MNFTKLLIVFVFMLMFITSVSAVTINTGTVFNPNGTSANYTSLNTFNISSVTVDSNEVTFNRSEGLLRISNTGLATGLVSFTNLLSPYNDIYDATNNNWVAVDVTDSFNISLSAGSELQISTYTGGTCNSTPFDAGLIISMLVLVVLVIIFVMFKEIMKTGTFNEKSLVLMILIIIKVAIISYVALRIQFLGC